MDTQADFLHIEDYGVIGDLHTLALVGINGSIDFLCFPRFDSPSVFARILDPQRGGFFQIAPKFEGEARHRQLYLPETNVLLTRFLSSEGIGEVVDFMPVEEVGPIHNVIRRLHTVHGEVRYTIRCEPRMNYGRTRHTIEARGDRDFLIRGQGEGGLTLRLHGTVPLRIEGDGLSAEVVLKEGETAELVLEQLEDGGTPRALDEGFVGRCLESTIGYWQRWIARSTYQGRWREIVHRSALTLKLLTAKETGALLAAGTFGLPEDIGGERNWDYRYTWIRDAAFTLYALLELGFRQEADAFLDWLDRVALADLTEGPSGPIQVLYGLDGRRELPEERLDHLMGYRGSRPVRAGNEAADQLQLDIYGELIDAVYVFERHRRHICSAMWGKLVCIVEWLVGRWREPDEGLWEVRGGRQQFLHSRVMSWVAMDRAIRIATMRSFPAPIERWRGVRDEIYQSVFDDFWDEARGCFVQAKGNDAIDASSLLLPIVHFLPFDDPKWRRHLAVLEEDLVEDSLVYRYRTHAGAPDGLRGDEGTFSMCSFWYVENLARSGQVDRARYYFEKMLSYANHLGLYSEQLGPMGEHLGNYPQAFTHLGLITAALALDRALERHAPPAR